MCDYVLRTLFIWSCLTFGRALHLVVPYIWSCLTFGRALHLVVPYIAADNCDKNDPRVDICCSGTAQVKVDNAFC